MCSVMLLEALGVRYVGQRLVVDGRVVFCVARPIGVGP